MQTRMSLARAAAALAASAFLLSLAACASSSSSSTAAKPEEHPVNNTTTPAELAATKSKDPIAANSAVLWVNGLGCPLCATNVDKQLERVPGVQTVNVDLSNGKVSLGFAPNAAHPSPARLGDAVEDAGFTLVKIEPGANGAAR